MMYLSKGVLLNSSSPDSITVQRCGCVYNLAAEEKRIWLNGRFSVEKAETESAMESLKSLGNLGLVETSADYNLPSMYRILINCVICKARVQPLQPLTPDEQFLWTWIDQAGFVLTFYELVFLMENQVIPEPALLGEENWCPLINLIYSRGIQENNTIMFQMEHALSCDKAIKNIMRLLSKGKILLI